MPRGMTTSNPTGKPDQSQDSRRRILQAALAVFAEFGFEGAATREIARRAKVHQPAIAYHFVNKEQLWKEASRHVAAEQIAFLKQSATNAQGEADPLAAFISDYIGFVSRNPLWAMFVVRAASQHDHLTKWLAQECLKPVVEQMFRAITGTSWPEADGSQASWAVSMVSLITGASVIFAERSLVGGLSTVDIQSPDFISEHARSVTLSVRAVLDGRRERRCA